MNKQNDQWYEIKDVSKVMIRGNEILILGFPEDSNDENHNCDFMGCTSTQCVIMRGLLEYKELGVTLKIGDKS